MGDLWLGDAIIDGNQVIHDELGGRAVLLLDKLIEEYLDRVELRENMIGAHLLEQNDPVIALLVRNRQFDQLMVDLRGFDQSKIEQIRNEGNEMVKIGVFVDV